MSVTRTTTRSPIALIVVLAFGGDAALNAHELINYEHEIKPILERSCGGGSCHINQTTSGVNLASYDGIMDSVGSQYGSPIVVAGDVANSPLYEKISSDAPDYGSRMPLSGEALTDAEINLIRRWIEDGLQERAGLLRGDANGDTSRDIADAIFILNFLFGAGAEPPCSLQADTNKDGSTDISDAIFLLLFLFGGGPDPGELDEDETRTCEGTTELSYASIQEKVFLASCAFASCHSSDTHRADLSLATLDESYENLVGVTPFNEVAREKGMLLVDPGRPENSFLLTKLGLPGPGEGNRMPANSTEPLAEPVVTAIREWILAGAPKEGTIEGVPDITDNPPPPIERLPQPPVPENGVQVHLPPFSIGPGREREIFYFVGQPFAHIDTSEVIVDRIDIHMLDASHHFIVYKWVGSSNPPAGVRSGGLNIQNQRLAVASQGAFFTLAFPEGVGLKFSRTDRFDLNSHYLNLNGEQTLLGEVYVNFFFAEPGSVHTFVKPIFDFGGDIYVPANQEAKAQGRFPSTTGLTDPGLGFNGSVQRTTHIYALSSHMHRHGTHFDVHHWNGSIGGQIYENWNWDDPIFQLYDPPLVLQPGEGLFYEATYFYHDPPHPSAVLEWGATSEDEMIILLGYYATP